MERMGIFARLGAVLRHTIRCKQSERSGTLRVCGVVFSTWIALCLLAATAPCVSGGRIVQRSRKSIALALQGGGAYGLIHFGAIEWLEGHHIPIDEIAGNSGGALTGGWYATGLDLLTDDELRYPPAHDGPGSMKLHGVAEVLSALDFDALFAESPSYKDAALARKLERRRYPSEFVYGIVAGGIRHPDGLLAAPKVRLLLDSIAVRYPAQFLYGKAPDAPFDALPTPFRCVATDASNSDPYAWRTVVLGGKAMLPKTPGYELSYSRALRASMAIPVAFTPVYVPPLLKPGALATYALVDGGIWDNYPIDVADQEFQPDILIGFCFDNPPPSNYVPRADYLHVQLDKGKFGGYEYSEWRELAWLGYLTMEKAYEKGLLDRLKPQMMSLDDYLAYRAKRRLRGSKISTTPQEVVADGAVNVDKVREVVLGQDITDPEVRSRLEKALLALLVDGDLATVGYELENRSGITVLHVQPEVHENGPPFVHFGTPVVAESRDRMWTRLEAKAVAPTPLGSSWHLEGAAGLDQQASFGLEIPFHSDRLVLAPSAGITETQRFGFSDGIRTSSMLLGDSHAGISLTYRPTRDSEISFGGFGAALATGESRGLPLMLPSGSYSYLSLDGEVDTTDAAVSPTSGFRGRFVLHDLLDYPGASRTLPQFDARASWFRPWPRLDTTLFFRGAAGTSFGWHAPFAAQYSLGGYGLLDAYVRDEILDSGYAYGGAGGLTRLSSLPWYVGHTYLGWWAETAQAAGREWNSGTIGLVIETRIGPLLLAGSLGDRGRAQFELVFGRFFL